SVRVSSLSAEQAAAAHAGPDGAFLIAAGPGTGKTYTATERFCWLVEQGVPPDRILAVTFNDRAADELRERITAELARRRPERGAHVPWNVPIHAPSITCAPSPGRRRAGSAVMRSRSSSAARSLKVTARIRSGGTPCSTSQQNRSVAV